VQAADDKFQNETEWVPKTGMFQRQCAELIRLQEAVVAANAERLRAEADARLQAESLSTKRKEFAHVARIATIEEVRWLRLQAERQKLGREPE
jgi:hypothetical protein